MTTRAAREKRIALAREPAWHAARRLAGVRVRPVRLPVVRPRRKRPARLPTLQEPALGRSAQRRQSRTQDSQLQALGASLGVRYKVMPTLKYRIRTGAHGRLVQAPTVADPVASRQSLRRLGA